MLPELLAACSSDSLASLACKMAGTVSAGVFEPPTVHGYQPGRDGAAGGFTWIIERFSKQHGRVSSPWVEVGRARGGWWWWWVGVGSVGPLLGGDTASVAAGQKGQGTFEGTGASMRMRRARAQER